MTSLDSLLKFTAHTLPLPPCIIGLTDLDTIITEIQSMHWMSMHNLLYIIVVVVVVYRLLSKACPVLTALEKYYKFECIVGFNGRVFVTSQYVQQTIVIRNCIIESEYMDKDTVLRMVDKATLKL